MDDETDLLAWRAFYLGSQLSNSDLSQRLRQLREIADGETTLHNSAAEIAKGTNLLNLVTRSTNQVVLGDRELARTILRGLRAAADVPD